MGIIILSLLHCLMNFTNWGANFFQQPNQLDVTLCPVSSVFNRIRAGILSHYDQIVCVKMIRCSNYHACIGSVRISTFITYKTGKKKRNIQSEQLQSNESPLVPHAASDRQAITSVLIAKSDVRPHVCSWRLQHFCLIELAELSG